MAYAPGADEGDDGGERRVVIPLIAPGVSDGSPMCEAIRSIAPLD